MINPMNGQKLSGKLLAADILESVRNTVQVLRKKNCIPTLGVLLVGDDPGSLSYIRQKQNAALSVGAQIQLVTLPDAVHHEEINRVISEFNDNPAVHGVIIQRPVPGLEGNQNILNSVRKEKDVDGFHPHSTFPVPVAAAVMKIMEYGFSHYVSSDVSFVPWLVRQSIAVIGRGETAGRPIATALTQHGCIVSVIHRSTPNVRDILKKSTIIISCAGKPDVLTSEDIQPGTIIIGVGLWRDNQGKIHGDFDETTVGGLSCYYTPTPGGVGPVNVACLIVNVVQACINQQGGLL